MNSDKPVLVLLHGWGVNQGVWRTIVAGLPDTIKILTPDLPGFGNATAFPSPYSLDAVLDFMAQDIPDNSYVAGWSLGGLLAIALAAKYPRKVKRLALIAASPCFLAQQDWPGMSAAVMQQFALSLKNNLPQTIDRFLAIQAMGSTSARNDTKQLKQAILAYPAPQAEAVEAALQLLSQCDLRAEFSTLNQPVAGYFGRLDALVPVSVVEKLKQLQPAAQFDIAGHASHAPFISHPDSFLIWLRSWLG
ncbi:pimeloyl-ACP methyl ester esterase BioH [Rheinheimera baltica]|uniref:pimeloyl-ACP methyl ester esterase BioH n=1 Tax=Rheinheimera baltica TaxID=67576 RepID=UPI00273D5A1D|nr:pimeloyl-ACP methyl ester esterase BioH [Rheinheimera baltica]MDP5142269.1 pimeloyl-ACP methyl ester esterase BioH [Rheinheimera baltica]